MAFVICGFIKLAKRRSLTKRLNKEPRSSVTAEGEAIRTLRIVLSILITIGVIVVAIILGVKL